MMEGGCVGAAKIFVSKPQILQPVFPRVQPGHPRLLDSGEAYTKQLSNQRWKESFNCQLGMGKTDIGGWSHRASSMSFILGPNCFKSLPTKEHAVTDYDIIYNRIELFH